MAKQYEVILDQVRIKQPFKWIVVMNPRGGAESEAFSDLTCPQETTQPCCRGFCFVKGVSEGCSAKAKPERTKTYAELNGWNVPRIQASKVIGTSVEASGLSPLHRVPGLCILLPARKKEPLQAALCRRTVACPWQSCTDRHSLRLETVELTGWKGGWQDKWGEALKTC